MGIDVDISHYDSDYYRDKESVPEHLARTITGVLNSRRAKNVLEVGCGTGFLLRFLEKLGFKCFGCDISFFAASASGQINASALQLPFRSASMDALISISMVEHLKYEETLEFLQEAKRVLKKDGLLFLVTPNNRSARSLIFGAKKVHSGDPTHIFFYSPFSMSRVLRRSGFGGIHSLHAFPPECAIDAWPLPVSLRGTKNRFLKNVVNWIMISSPLGLLRDSFWMTALKKDN